MSASCESDALSFRQTTITRKLAPFLVKEAALWVWSVRPFLICHSLNYYCVSHYNVAYASPAASRTITFVNLTQRRCHDHGGSRDI